MITDENNPIFDEVGLPVIFDGDHNSFLFNGKSLNYPIGGMLAEYARLPIDEMKSVILSCSHLDEKPTIDNLDQFVEELATKIIHTFDPVPSAMAMVEISQVLHEWNDAIINGRSEAYRQSLEESVFFDKSGTSTYEKLGFEQIGNETVRQMVLSSYYHFYMCFLHVRYLFLQAMKFENKEEDASEQILSMLLSLFSDLVPIQHIDFKIFCTSDGFRSLYTIKSSMSLLAFELAHWMIHPAPFVKCLNCGHYFIPDGRKDQVYCTYPSPQNKEKTCREIGAQITRSNKEKNDVVTHEYRKKYMRYKMLTKRHPGDREAAKRFDALTEGMRDWKTKLANGTATTDQFLEWISQF